MFLLAWLLRFLGSHHLAGSNEIPNHSTATGSAEKEFNFGEQSILGSAVVDVVVDS
jgi:hypothetical protein